MVKRESARQKNIINQAGLGKAQQDEIEETTTLVLDFLSALRIWVDQQAIMPMKLDDNVGNLFFWFDLVMYNTKYLTHLNCPKLNIRMRTRTW